MDGKHEKGEGAKVTSLSSRRSHSAQRPRATGVTIGRIAGVSESGLPLVEFEGSGTGPLAARYLMPNLPEALASLTARRQEVLLNFENDDTSRPIIVGFLQPMEGGEKPVPAHATGSAFPEVVVVDGQRLRIEGKDEIVLSCGEASITLRRNGKVIINGTHLELESLGANWIRGADVQVN